MTVTTSSARGTLAKLTALFVCLLLHGLTQGAPASSAPGHASSSFANPLLPSGPDPWVAQKDGWYYFTATTGVDLTIWRTRSMADLASAQKAVVWRPPVSGPYSHDIWAPELHFLGGRWYLYFAADAGSNESHRIWVLENPAANPLDGEWTMKGKLADPDDRWAIDATVFESGDRMYALWSGWEGEINGVQSIYIAAMENAWTLRGRRVRLSTPSFPWEKVGDAEDAKRRLDERNPGSDPSDPPHIDVNEGPEVLQHAGKIFVTYSASACWKDAYALGMLTASADADLLDAASWSKSPIPQFWQSPSAHAFGTGHNGFFKSPDGRQDWIIYHANSEPGQGCGNRRAPRMQPFTWNPDGTPNFGRPVPAGEPLARPSGEPR